MAARGLNAAQRSTACVFCLTEASTLAGSSRPWSDTFTGSRSRRSTIRPKPPATSEVCALVTGARSGTFGGCMAVAQHPEEDVAAARDHFCWRPRDGRATAQESPA